MVLQENVHPNVLTQVLDVSSIYLDMYVDLSKWDSFYWL